MKKTFAKFFCAALAAVVGTAGFASCGGRKNDSFYIGASGPLTEVVPVCYSVHG